MADQTEQEQIDPIARCIQWLSFMVTNADDRRIVQAELESIRSAHQQETSRLLAALSTVDSQIHQQAELLAQRWDTVERLTKQHNEWKAQAEQHAALLRERDAQIASLSEFRDAVASALCVENPFGEINNAAIVEAADITLSQLFEFSAEMTTLRAERDAAQQEIEREQAATRQQQESASRLAVALAGRVGELLALQRAATGVVAGATEWWRECPWCRRANYQNAPAHFVDCPLEALRAALSADVETERSDFASFREHHLATEQAWEAEKQVVARLSAQVEQQERANQIIREEGVEARAIIQSRDIEIVKLNRVVDTLRAERDAAQQQIATLTEAQAALRDELATKILCVPFRGADVKPTGAYLLLDDVLRVLDRSDLRAALQSTRPQEQP